MAFIVLLALPGVGLAVLFTQESGFLVGNTLFLARVREVGSIDMAPPLGVSTEQQDFEELLAGWRWYVGPLRGKLLILNTGPMVFAAIRVDVSRATLIPKP